MMTQIFDPIALSISSSGRNWDTRCGKGPSVELDPGSGSNRFTIGHTVAKGIESDWCEVLDRVRFRVRPFWGRVVGVGCLVDRALDGRAGPQAEHRLRAQQGSLRSADSIQTAAHHVSLVSCRAATLAEAWCLTAVGLL